jgi:hypothetical protein
MIFDDPKSPGKGTASPIRTSMLRRLSQATRRGGSKTRPPSGPSSTSIGSGSSADEGAGGAGGAGGEGASSSTWGRVRRDVEMALGGGSSTEEEEEEEAKGRAASRGGASCVEAAGFGAMESRHTSAESQLGALLSDTRGRESAAWGCEGEAAVSAALQGGGRPSKGKAHLHLNLHHHHHQHHAVRRRSSHARTPFHPSPSTRLAS